MTSSSSGHQIVISADGHAGGDVWDYKPYLEKRFHDDFDVWATNYSDPWGVVAGASESGENIGFASFDVPVNWDSKARLELTESLGIAAEVLFPNTAPPFLPSGAVSAPPPSTPREYEYRWAGVRAHNRWMADFCADTPGRRGGFAQIFLNDVDAAIEEARWAKEAGLLGLLLPSDHEGGMLLMYEPRYEPFWAAAEELGLPIHRHQVFPSLTVQEAGPAAPWIGMLQIPFMAKRGVAQFLCSGIFERHPGLKLVFTELSDSVALKPYVAELDDWYRVGLNPGGPGTRGHFVRDAALALSKSPSEYFASNCYIAGPLDLRQAVEAELPGLMFGADVPHSEGTGPYTAQAVRVSAEGLSDTAVDALLYKTAVEVYGFDEKLLQGVADRIGPTRQEVRTPLTAEEMPSYPDESRWFGFAGAGAFRD
jgi:predicted TIM-barrel fold metal-dependent hydrolase